MLLYMCTISPITELTNVQSCYRHDRAFTKYFDFHINVRISDLNLKILKDDSTCPGACHVIKWVKGCFDALDKKYVRK